MEIKLFNKDITVPTKSHPYDGGYDTYLPKNITIKPFETKVIGLGIGISVPIGYAGMLVPRSSIASKGLIIQTSIIDSGYTGEIHLIITNCSVNPQKFKKNDRLASLVIYEILRTNLEIVEELPLGIRGIRGTRGLGSTGK